MSEAALRDADVSPLPAVKKQTDPAAWLQRNLEATHLQNTEVIQVSMAGQSGADTKDQAAIINAVVKAYVDDVVNVDRKRRADRHVMITNLTHKYRDMIDERREQARKLSESAASVDQFGVPDQKRSSHLYESVVERRLALKLDRAQTETLLRRKPKDPLRKSEQVRKEIAQLEEHLAVLTAQEAVLVETLEDVMRTNRRGGLNRLELDDAMAEITQMEDTYRKVDAEAAAISLELEGPPRVRVLDGAAATGQ